MSDKIDEMAGFIGGVSQKSGSKASGKMVGGLNSETLIENPVEKGVLSDGFRVSDEVKVLAGESKSGIVISGTELESVEFGSLETDDKNDAHKNSFVATAPRNNIKWESRVMNMVGRVLGGKLNVDNEMEDVDDTKSRSEVYLAAEKDAWQNAISKPTSEIKRDAWQDEIGEAASENKIEFNRTDKDNDSAMLDSNSPAQGSAIIGTQDLISHEIKKVDVKDAWQDDIGEPTSENKIEFNGTDNSNDPVMLDSNSPAEGSGLNGNQDLISHEAVLNVQLESKKMFKSKNVLYIPKARGENDNTEKEGNYYMSDLVWGKVSYHPWWPGQIFSPLSATDEADIHLKNKAYLIAYFGDGTYAWNKELQIKPFGMFFSKMDKQSNSEKFCHAVQCALVEVSRRVEFGLSCPCLPPNVCDGIKFQVIENTGVVEKSSRRAGGDVLYGAPTFSPDDLLLSLESLARCPQSEPDRLQFTIKKAQLLAYNRWKGRYVLPIYEQCHTFLENDTLLNAKEEKEGLYHDPVLVVDNGVSSIKMKSTAVYAIEGARNVISSGEHHEMVNHIASNSKRRRGRKPKNLLPVGPNPMDIPTPNLVLTKLSLLAKKPTQGHGVMVPVVGLLREFRNFVCPQTLSQVHDAMNSGQLVSEIGNGVSSKKRKSSARDGSSRKRKEKSLSVLMSSGSSSSVATAAKKPVRRGPTNAISSIENHEMVNCAEGVDIAMDSGKNKSEQPSNFQTADTFGISGINDSYWTDTIIVHTDSQPEADVDDNKKEPVLVDLGPSDPSDLVDEVSKKYCPTALQLKFSKLKAIPAIPILNEIFNAYGPLIESETKILSKSKRAVVVFKRKEDAGSAFSSTGKYRTFGPALTSYRLKYVGHLLKNRPTSSKKKKKAGP